MGKGRFREMRGRGGETGVTGKVKTAVLNGEATINLEDITVKDMWRPGVLQIEGNNEVKAFFVEKEFLWHRKGSYPHLIVSLSA